MLAPIAVRTRVVIIAHRNELARPTNTGRLASRLLAGATLRIRGAAPSEARSEAPSAPQPDTSSDPARRLVLFPTDGARALSPREVGPDPLMLVVPDASWSQARRIVHREPIARDAERVALPPGAPSRYLLRRAGREGGLCSLEAIARALAILEGPSIEAHLLAVLDAFVARHQSIRPRRARARRARQDLLR
jgi:DTW domain-containing protein YfiP